MGALEGLKGCDTLKDLVCRSKKGLIIRMVVDDDDNGNDGGYDESENYDDDGSDY